MLPILGTHYMLVFSLYLEQKHKYQLQSQSMIPFHTHVIQEASVEFFMLKYVVVTVTFVKNYSLCYR